MRIRLIARASLRGFGYARQVRRRPYFVTLGDLITQRLL